MAIHSSTIAWKIPWTEEPGRGHKESEMTERLHFHFQVSICVLEKYWSFKYLNTEIILFVRVAIGKDVILSFATWSPCWLF